MSYGWWLGAWSEGQKVTPKAASSIFLRGWMEANKSDTCDISPQVNTQKTEESVCQKRYQKLKIQ